MRHRVMPARRGVQHQRPRQRPLRVPAGVPAGRAPRVWHRRRDLRQHVRAAEGGVRTADGHRGRLHGRVR